MLKRHLTKWHRAVFAILVISLATLCLTFWCSLFVSRPHYREVDLLFNTIEDNIDEKPDFTLANNITGYLQPIIPNIVHFIRFDNPDLDFHDMLAIKAAHRHQKPDKIFLHCNFPKPTGHYWDMVKNISELEVKFLPRPTQLFGKRLSACQVNDVARLSTLMVHGGIFIENDVYIVQSMDAFRHFEFAIGWPPGEYPSTRVLVAHKDARFLRHWYNEYRDYYPKSWCWYFGTMAQPPVALLEEKPELAHRVPELFGVRDVSFSLYRDNSSIWRYYYSISLRRETISHKYILNYHSQSTLTFDELNIKNLKSTFGEMARSAIYGSVL